MSPEQVRIINISDSQKEYCEKLKVQLLEKGVRVTLDSRIEKLGFKIREAQLQRVSYILVVGDKEVESNVVSVRMPSGESTHGIEVTDFLERISAEISNRDLESSFK